MFESASDKGLFTFYWESMHPCSKQQQPSTKRNHICKQQHAQSKKVSLHNKKKSEQIVKKDIFKLEIDKITESSCKSKANSIQILRQPITTRPQQFQFDKLYPQNMIAQVSKRLKVIQKHSNITQAQQSQCKQQTKKSDFRKLLSLQKDQALWQQLSQRTPKDPFQYNVELSQRSKELQSKKYSPPYYYKNPKVNNQKYQKQVQKENQSSQQHYLFPDLKHSPSLTRPKQFRKQILQRQKSCKDKFIIQKIFARRTQISNYASILNIGLCDQQKRQQSWKKKKQQFLQQMLYNNTRITQNHR